MIQPICRDINILKQKSKPASQKDTYIGQDLKDTLLAHRDECVGMAANMIGRLKNIIIVHTEFMDIVMYNPKILAKSKPYQTKEGCLSLPGQKETQRYEKIIVSYQDDHFKRHKGTFNGFTAQIIQHEMDHLNGVLIL